MDEADVRAFVQQVGAADLVTVGPDGFPESTLLPIVWNDDRVIGHFARANQHWSSIGDGDPVLLIVHGPEAYISPSWYAAKREHGRVVPTWNYSAVHILGRARIVEDPVWLLDAVTQLPDLHEGQRPQPWRVSDAPERSIAGMVKAIVGVEIVVDRVEAKAKLSQNRSTEDAQGVVDGLRAGGDQRGEWRVADEMARRLSR